MIQNLLTRALFMSTPLILGAVGEVIAERAGMMVTGIEGIFLMGAFGGFIATYYSGSLFIGFLGAMLIGILTAAVYAAVCICFHQNQVVTGTAINILAVGMCAFFYRVLYGTPILPITVEPLKTVSVPILSKIPFIGPILFEQNAITYSVYILVPVVFFVLYKTSLGLVIRSTGENPEAVDVVGINVNKIRFLVVLVAGAFSGIAGAYYSIANLGLVSTEIIGGRGWIAFAICFLGNWNPLGALLAGVIFGISEAIAINVQSFGAGFFPNELFTALPYILTIVLTISRKSFNVPAKLGVAYQKEN